MKKKLYICPKAKKCIDDCDICKEPHELKDCMRPVGTDWTVMGSCKVKCIPIKRSKNDKG